MTVRVYLPPLVCVRPYSSGRAAVSALVLTIATFSESQFIILSLGDLKTFSMQVHNLFHAFLTAFITNKIMQLLLQR